MNKRLLHWVLPLVPPLVALVVQLQLWPLVRPNFLYIFYPATFVSAWLGGLRGAALGGALSVIGALWFFAPPEHSFAKPVGQYAAAAVFFLTSLAFGVFQDVLRRANWRSLSALRDSESARQAEKKLTDAMTSLLEQAPDGIFVANLEGRYTEVNDAGCRMLGYTREELLAKSILDLIPAEESPRLEREKAALLQGGGLVSEWKLRRKDGTYLPVEVSARILSDGRWQGFVRDISERERLQTALRESHRDLNRAQGVARAGSWRFDFRANTLWWSDETYRILGVPADAPATYENFLGAVHPDDRTRVDREWKDALRGKRYDIEHRIVVDGAVRWVRDKAELQFDEQSAPLSCIGITQDITDRKQYEAEIRDARERLELALRGADLAAWDWNIETGEVVYNARWAEMRGYRPDEIRAHVESWSGGIHPEDWPLLQSTLKDYLEGRRADYEMEHRVRTKSGQWIWVLDRGKVFARNELGKPTRMVGTELDITARKAAQEALRLAEAKASGILSISADAIISIDEQQHITLFNEGAEKLFGYAKKEVMGAPLDLLLPERSRAAHRRYLGLFAAGQATARKMGQGTASIVGRRKDGREFLAEAAISKLAVGGAVVLTVALRDVTERKRIEEEQQFLSEFAQILASSLDLPATLTSVGQLVTRKVADACTIYLLDEGSEVRRLQVTIRDPERQWVAEALAQSTLRSTRAPEIWAELEADRPLLIERVSDAFLRKLSRSEEHQNALRAVQARSIIVSPLRAHGKLLGAIAFVSCDRERTYGRADLRFFEQIARHAAYAIDNAELYAEATRAVRTRDNVLGIVAHDLRNPLGTILMQASRLGRPGGQPERRSRKPGEAIERSARRMNRLIQDLLDVSRMEAGVYSVDRRPVSASQVVSDAIEAEEALATAASLELTREVSHELPELWADRDRLLQVFENLIGNAIKFTPEGGRITVGAGATESGVLFWVKDTGAGIAASDLAQVFDRFWQAENAERYGAGLGLAIVKGLVEAHGGRIWIESTMGHGTTFYFIIPKLPHSEPWLEQAAPHHHA